MSLDDSLVRDGSRLKPVLYIGVVTLVAGVLVALLDTSGPSNDGAIVAASAPTAKASAPVIQAGPQWQDLNAAQKKILRPLAATWNSLGLAQKNKWIALTNSYPQRTPEDQARLQSRMAEWAALTPSDRERARLNFAETKKLSPANLAAEWAAYQELSASEKQRLAEKGSGKPAGAAVAVTPVANDKLAVVPITRRIGQLPDSAAVAKPNIDPNTLLPRATVPVSPASAAIEVPGTSASDATVPAVNADTLSPN